MTDDIAARIPRRGWSAIGGRVMPPADKTGGEPDVSGPPSNRGELKGRVSLASAEGLLETGRPLRSRRSRWVRRLLLWMLVVLLAPALVGWIWGLIAVASRG